MFTLCVYAQAEQTFLHISAKKKLVSQNTTQLNPKYMCKHNAKIIVNLPYLLRFMHGHGRSSVRSGCVVLTAMGIKICVFTTRRKK